MASSGLFGTDGVRGRANVDLTPELALAVGSAAVRVLTTGRPRVVVGMDTRPSSPMLATAVRAGVASAGGDAILLGVAPSALVAHATAHGADLGIMVTASHNPYPDNGIKVFGPGGRKLTDAEEAAISEAVDEVWTRPEGTEVGLTLSCDGSEQEAYVASLLASLPGRLDGLRIVVDCANGASSWIAPDVYTEAGATVIAIHAGDGLINEGCGATHLEDLQAAVLAEGADVGVAHDGDADRCLLVDAGGQIVDGDQILGILAAGQSGVVTTVMANLALHHAMAAAGTRVLTTPVGDRHVLEAMHREGIAIGGEQSGHVILLDHATTGDGILTALHVLAKVVSSGRTLAELAAVVTPLPQVLVNVTAERSRAADADVLAAVASVEGRIGSTGRVLVRPSGTEALVRVMVEAPSSELARELAEEIAAVLRR
jgi:phosphoglucosamine mutase